MCTALVSADLSSSSSLSSFSPRPHIESVSKVHLAPDYIFLPLGRLPSLLVQPLDAIMTAVDAATTPLTLKTKQSRRFRPSATESFVIVKPPPTVSQHHPLNLQIQYIPPGAEGQRRKASSSSDSESSSSKSSSRNGRIVPLYNLHTHSHGLLANVICDAGTDDKIAKFHKHGIEIVSVGVFAPVETWSSGSSLAAEDLPSATRNSSFIDVPSLLTDNTSESIPSPQATRRFLGKLFSKQQQQQQTTAPEPPPTPTSPDYHPQFALAPVLGTVPTLLSRTLPPVGRAISHTWLCKKWCKEGDENWLTQALNITGQDRCGVDIRIEWARATNKRDGGPSRQASLANLQAEDLEVPPVPSVQSSSTEELRGRSSFNLAIPPSPLFGRRKGSSGSASMTRMSGMSDLEDDSDPEDSEVPWVCTVVIRPGKTSGSTSPSAPLPPTATRAKSRGTPLRFKVASLAPAPHHPKVVAQLKMQYPLPDVDLLDAVILPREGLPGAPETQPVGKHILTAEEIKDIVCSTVLWVVVREGFSGLSKKTKPRHS